MPAVWGTQEYDPHRFLELLDWVMKRRISYVFLKLVAGASHPVKELSEALSIFKRVYDDDKTRVKKSVVIEVCSGKRGLVAALCALFLRNVTGVAVDVVSDAVEPLKELSSVLGSKLRLFMGIDVYSDEFAKLVESLRREFEYVVMVAIHSCRTLAVRIMEIFKRCQCDKLILVPCCAHPSWARKTVGVEIHGYWDWIYALWKYATEVLQLPARVEIEHAMLSNANAVIVIE